MKRRDLLKKIAEHADREGLEMETVEGANHTKIWVGHQVTVVARHSEINEITARAVLKQWGVR